MEGSKPEIIAIFEDEDSNHFWMKVDQGTFQDRWPFSLRTPDGVAFEGMPTPIGHPADEDPYQPQNAIVSFTVPEENHAFEVLDAQGAPLLEVTPATIAEVCHGRDMEMANPAIDGLYGTWREIHPVVAAPPTDPVTGPLFSLIVPLYKTPIPFFDELMATILGQTYGRWELILVNASPEEPKLQEALAKLHDPRIKVITLEENLGITGNTNAGIAEATGDYIAFVDHDDVLDPELLGWYAHAIAEDPQTDLLYCDEDVFQTDVAKGYEVRFKPEINPGFILSNNYVLHCLCVSRHALDQVELSPKTAEGAQDFDLTLKILEVARSVAHIPQILYHWRQHAASSNGKIAEVKPYAIEAGRQAVKAHLKRVGVEAEVENALDPCMYQPVVPFPEGAFSVVMAVPEGASVAGALESLEAAAGSIPFETILVGAGDKPADAPADAHWLQWGKPSDWSAMVQAGVAQAVHDTILILDPRVRWDAADSLEPLLGLLAVPGIGLVSPRVLSPDGLSFFTGLCVSPTGGVIPINQGYPADRGGYFGYAISICAYSGLAPYALAAKKEVLAPWTDGFSAPSETMEAMNLAFHVRKQGLGCVNYPFVDITLTDNPVRWVWHWENDDDRTARAELWGRWGDSWKVDVLANPGEVFDGGYPHLDISGIQEYLDSKKQEKKPGLFKRLFGRR